MTFVILRIVVLVYVGLLLLLFGCQTKLIFPATRGLSGTPRALGLPYEEVTLRVGDETTLGWYLPVENPRGTVLFSHGNAGNLESWMYAMDVYRNLGFDVLLYDYGGYGLSTGRPSERRCYEDGRAMWRYLTETREIPADRIVLIGRSLGTGVAAQLATEAKPGAIVLESPFLSLGAMAQQLYPFFPARYLVRHKFDTESKMAAVNAPILIVHSKADELVPYSHGKRLYDLANDPKEFLEIAGTHNEAFSDSELEYSAALDKFLTPYFPKREQLPSSAGS